MSYLVMEVGAVPNPVNRRPQGPVKLYRTHVDGGLSRNLNPVESLPMFAEIASKSVGLTAAREASLYLEAFRSLLVPFNTKRHVIWVDTSGQSCPPTVRVNFDGMEYYKTDNAVTDCLKCIDQMLESAEGWVYHLHGERLNGQPGNLFHTR